MSSQTAWNIGAEQVALKVKRLDTPTGLAVAQVEVESGAVAFDEATRKVTLARPGTFTAVVEEADLSAFVKSKAPEGVEIDAVRLKPGGIVVEATVWFVISVSGEAECSLRIEEEQRLMVDVESVSVLGGSLRNMVQKQIDAMNPVLDTSDLPVDVRLQAVTIEKGRIVLSGTLAPK